MIASPDNTTSGTPLDSANHFAVGVKGEDVVVVRLNKQFTREEALNLAAWIAELADPTGKRFEQIRKEIRQ